MMFEGDEAVALRLVGTIVANHFGLLEAGVFAERLGEELVGHFVAEISAENSEVVRVPVRQRRVLPYL